MRIIRAGRQAVAAENATPMMMQRRSMMVTDFFREAISLLPQYRETITEAPMPIPMQAM